MLNNPCSDIYEKPNTGITRLKPVSSGEERCAPGHFWGPGVRSSYVIHYVISGTGVFYCGQNKYTVKKGQIFVIFPNTIVKYQADKSDPWHYAWAVFGGDEAKAVFEYIGITHKCHVYTPPDGEAVLRTLRDMPKERGVSMYEVLRFSSLLYELMATLAGGVDDSEGRENEYLTSAVRYIRAHYQSDISVDSVSAYIGISRKYLFALFKSSLGVSPKDYIVNYRMSKAKELLGDSNLSVSNVAFSVGYKDPLNFSRMFKCKVGLSPSDYRNNLSDKK